MVAMGKARHGRRGDVSGQARKRCRDRNIRPSQVTKIWQLHYAIKLHVEVTREKFAAHKFVPHKSTCEYGSSHDVINAIQ